MRQRFVLRPDIPLAEPDSHPVEVGVVDAVAGGHHPPLGDQRTAARDPLAEEPLFNDCHHPGVTSKCSILATNYAVATGIDLSTFWQRNKKGIFTRAELVCRMKEFNRKQLHHHSDHTTNSLKSFFIYTFHTQQDTLATQHTHTIHAHTHRHT